MQEDIKHEAQDFRDDFLADVYHNGQLVLEQRYADGNVFYDVSPSTWAERNNLNFEIETFYDIDRGSTHTYTFYTFSTRDDE